MSLKKSLSGYKNINAYVKNKIKRFTGMPKTFDSLFELMFSEKDNVMFEESDGLFIKKTTYGDAKKRAGQISASLSLRLNGVKGGVIGLCMENGAEWIEAFWAILMAGFNPLLINTRIDDETLIKALKRVNAVAVVSDGKTFDAETVFFNEISATETVATEIAVTQTADSQTSAVNDGKFGTEFIVMSSGTSGEVKLCAYSAEEMFYQIKAAYGIVKKSRLIKKHYKGEIKLLTFLPFYHVFGMFAVYSWFGFFSRTFVKLNDLAPEVILSTIKRHNVTHIFSVPLFWNKVYVEADKKIKARGEKTYNKFKKGLKISCFLGNGLLGRLFKKFAFKEVRDNLFGDSIVFLITGGSVIPAETVKFFNGIGYRLANGYGMSEIGITSVELSNREKVIESLSVGEPLDSVCYRINADGELEVKGGSVSKYVIEGEKIINPKDGWFNTRDMAFKKGSRYYITGRKDDLIITSSGENVNPEITEKLFKVNGVTEACLVGDGDKIILIAEVPDDLPAQSVENIISELNAAVSKSGLSGEIKSVAVTVSDLLGDDIKLNRKKIKARYLNGQLKEYKPIGKTEIKNALAEKVKQVFASVLGTDSQNIKTFSDFFMDLGGTSLDYFALIGELRNNFNLPFPDGEKFNTVESVVNYVSEQK